MSISPKSFTLNPFVGTVRNETVPFGNLTLSSDGGYQVKDGSGNPLTGATIVATGTASGFQVSASGVVTPASNGAAASEDGKTLVVVDGDVKVVLTISVLADTYHASTEAEVDAAWSAMGAAGGKTVKLRDGVYDGSRSNLFANRSKSNPTTISADNRDNVDLGEIWVEGSNNLILDNFKEGNVTIYGPNTDFTLQNCEITGPSTIDPNGDYSTANPAVPMGILITQSGNANISIIQNDIHDVNLGITSGDSEGNFYIARNSIRNVYEDCIKVGGNATSFIVEDNLLAGVIAAGSDLNNPHPDFLQFLGRGVGSNFTGIEIRRNVLLALYTRAGAQGIFLDDMPEGWFYDGAIIEGNLVVNHGPVTTGIRCRQAKNFQVRGNTVVTQRIDGGSTTPGIMVGDTGILTNNVFQNNVANGYLIYGDGNVLENNVTLGSNGSTIAYTAAFQGSGFSPTTYAEALAEFAMKPNGPLDVDNSGGPSVGDVGAVGSGYVTFPPTLPSETRGSLDNSYTA